MKFLILSYARYRQFHFLALLNLCKKSTNIQPNQFPSSFFLFQDQIFHTSSGKKIIGFKLVGFPTHPKFLNSSKLLYPWHEWVTDEFRLGRPRKFSFSQKNWSFRLVVIALSVIFILQPRHLSFFWLKFKKFSVKKN